MAKFVQGRVAPNQSAIAVALRSLYTEKQLSGKGQAHNVIFKDPSMCNEKETSDMSQEVSKDTVYREMYNEMRRFRDYQFSSSMWFTLQLIAIEVGVVNSRYDAKWCDFQKALSTYFCCKIIIILVAFVIAFIASLLIWYSHSQYEAIREATDNYLEPPWKKTQLGAVNFGTCMQAKRDLMFQKHLGCRHIKPHGVYLCTVWGLFLIIVVTIICY